MAKFELYGFCLNIVQQNKCAFENIYFGDGRNAKNEYISDI
jgi:hypothetical protein